jgi:hypothetical protein
MRAHLEVEWLESMRLLSSTAVALHAPAMVDTPTVAPVASRPVHLVGTAKGTYHARLIPDAGKFYTFGGAGMIGPVGQTVVKGTVALPGLIIRPVPITILPLVEASGQLTLSSPRGGSGTLTLMLSAPSHDNATTLPSVFGFKIMAATGPFKGDTGSGWVVIGVDPVKPSPGAGPVIGVQEHGRFTMTFLQFAPPSPVPQSGSVGS